MTMTMKCARYS